VRKKEREFAALFFLLWGRRKKKGEEEKKTAVFFRLKRVAENRAFNCPLSRHPPKQKKGKKIREGKKRRSEPLSLSFSLCSRAKRFN